MSGFSVAELIPVLQVAVGPVILVSGVGLLLLTMTNRLGRVLDRSRALSREYRSAPLQERRRLQSQVEVLWRRAKLLQRAILLASLSVLLAAILVIVLFLTALLNLETAGLIGALFVAGMASLIGSLVLFLVDLDRSLAALRLELSESRAPDERAG